VSDAQPATDRGDSVTVVIAVYNGEATLGEQLDSLARQSDGDFQLIVVDNNSTDGTAALAASYADRIPGLRVLPCPKPGANAARNLGLETATTDIVLYCDADDVMHADWVREMRRALRDADAAGGTIEDVTLTNDPEILRWLEPHAPGVPVVAGFLPRAVFANLGVRTEAARAIGGLNSAFHYGADDTEFCWRLQLAGYTLVAAPDAICHYRRRQDLAGILRRSYVIGLEKPHLYKEFAQHGMPRSLAGGLARAARLLLKAPKAAIDPAFRPSWRRQLAILKGHVVGSWKYRTLYL
jgi:glycosyltransferase involved in cell wall biosynthesis